MIFCNIDKQAFKEYVYVPVIWSGDYLPICPYCKKSPYETGFRTTHSEIEEESKLEGGSELRKEKE